LSLLLGLVIFLEKSMAYSPVSTGIKSREEEGRVHIVVVMVSSPSRIGEELVGHGEKFIYHLQTSILDFDHPTNCHGEKNQTSWMGGQASSTAIEVKTPLRWGRSGNIQEFRIYYFKVEK
jgi:hypothetical protein